MNSVTTEIERYATAVSDGRSDRDAILAGAMAGGWATNLFRLKYANDAKEYQGVLVQFKLIAIQVARRHKWAADDRIKPLAKHVLDYWITDVCPSCAGKGFEPIASTPMLSESACAECDGTGTRKFPEKGVWFDRGNVLIEYIRYAEKSAGAEIMRKLRKDCDF